MLSFMSAHIIGQYVSVIQVFAQRVIYIKCTKRFEIQPPLSSRHLVRNNVTYGQH